MSSTCWCLCKYALLWISKLWWTELPGYLYLKTVPPLPMSSSWAALSQDTIDTSLKHLADVFIFPFCYLTWNRITSSLWKMILLGHTLIRTEKLEIIRNHLYEWNVRWVCTSHSSKNIFGNSVDKRGLWRFCEPFFFLPLLPDEMSPKQTSVEE